MVQSSQYCVSTEKTHFCTVQYYNHIPYIPLLYLEKPQAYQGICQFYSQQNYVRCTFVIRCQNYNDYKVTKHLLVLFSVYFRTTNLYIGCKNAKEFQQALTYLLWCDPGGGVYELNSKSRALGTYRMASLLKLFPFTESRNFTLYQDNILNSQGGVSVRLTNQLEWVSIRLTDQLGWGLSMVN